jgi:hypothetical protein
VTSISKPDETHVVLILCIAVFGFLFNVLESVWYFHDILKVLARSRGSAKQVLQKVHSFRIPCHMNAVIVTV